MTSTRSWRCGRSGRVAADAAVEVSKVRGQLVKHQEVVGAVTQLAEDAKYAVLRSALTSRTLGGVCEEIRAQIGCIDDDTLHLLRLVQVEFANEIM